MAIIDRAGAEALFPQDVATSIIQGAIQESAVLTLGTRLPDMTTNQRRLPILESLPMAYFVNGEIGFKQYTNVSWGSKFIEAEEIAVIVPIPEAVLDDADYDIFEQIQPLIRQAFGRVLDGAVLYGTNRPASWEAGIVPLSVSAGNVIAEGTGADLYDDIMSENGVISLVEQDGFMVNGHIAQMQMAGRLRGLRDANGQPIFSRDMQNSNTYALDGSPIYFQQNGAFDATQSLLISGDFTNLVYAIRQDLTYKVLTEAVIQDPATGAIVYNLAQQDMVALRAVMRLGWNVPSPIENNTTGNTVFPFAVLTPAPAPAPTA